MPLPSPPRLFAGLLGWGLALALVSALWRPPPIVAEPPAQPPASAPPSAPAALRLPPPEASASAPASAEPPLPACEPAGAPRVAVHGGDVHLCAAGAAWEPLTRHGKASFATLTPSRKQALYVRDEGQQKIPLGGDDAVDIPDHRYALIDLATRAEREVARNDPKDSGCMNLWGLRLVDDTYALVHADGYGAPNVHNHSMCGIDLALGKLVMVGRRSTCAVPLTAGRYRGMLWVAGFDFKVGQGLSDWQGVVDRKGHRVRSFEDDPFVVDRNNDGRIEGDERDGLCAEPLADPAAMEAVQRKL